MKVEARERFEARGLGQLNILSSDEGKPGERTGQAEKLRDKERFEPSGVFTSTENTSGNAGPAGDVTVKAPRIALRDGAEIASESLNGAGGGFVRVAAQESLTLSNQAEITAQSVRADSGDVEIEGAGYVFLTDGSLIATRVRGEDAPGDAGDILVSGSFLLLDASNILAEGVEGQGGDIDIRSLALAVAPDSAISALSQRNLDGDIGIDSPIGQITDAVAALENPAPDASGALRMTCSQRAAEGASGAFRIETAGHSPVDPWSYLPALYAPAPDGGGAALVPRRGPCPDGGPERGAAR